MTTFEINGAEYEVSPLTVLATSRFTSLTERLTEFMTQSTDEDHKVLSTQFSSYIWLYAKFVVTLSKSPHNFPDRTASLKTHADAFVKWVDQEPHKIKAVKDKLDEITAPPGNKLHIPDSALEDEEKKT